MVERNNEIEIYEFFSLSAGFEIDLFQFFVLDSCTHTHYFFRPWWQP
jgi:hypothetical protein